MNTENNLAIYDRLKSVPKQYLKTIGAGRLKGMSDIKPQWRIEKLTEVFGVVGFGWNTENVRYSYEKVGEEIVCNCELELVVKVDGEWSRPIHGVGGSAFTAWENKTDWDTKEKTKVLYVSDEAQKMAYTDAISVASKMLGLASDIYMGHGGKYDSNNEEPKEPNTNTKKEDDGKQWLQDKGFEFLMASGTKEQINEAFATRKMKKEFKEKLTEKLNSL